MDLLRIIPRLDIKQLDLIKGIHLEGWRKLGNPNQFAKKYYLDNADELIFIDSVASLYNRDNLFKIINEVTKDVFIPITIGGGIKKIEDVSSILKSGADKIAVNTNAFQNKDLLKEIINVFGSQCLTLSVQAKKNNDNLWEAYIDAGREPTGVNVIDWIKECQNLGIGELLLTSIDKEGTEKGFDKDLILEVSKIIKVPLIISGGFGKLEDLLDIYKLAKIDGLAIASCLHYNKISINDIKSFCKMNNIPIR